jgi:hypothetical protein
MQRSQKQAATWAWVLGGIVIAVLTINLARNAMKQEVKQKVRETLQQQYGDAIQDYRSDPIRFRARIQQQVTRGQATQQEADQFIEMVRTMSQKLP